MTRTGRVDRDPSGFPGDALFEPLEQRRLLSFDPATFPALDDLVGMQNTVVRVDTTEGFVDLELFDRVGPDGESGSVAKASVDHFLDIIADGGYDDWFFHRLVEDFVLQGGGFRFTEEEGLGRTPETETIANEFDPVRSNVERTIAYAKLGGDPDSATNQWFFNLADNSENLDNQNGGFTVFGRVANDASWQVVLDIAGLPTNSFADLDSQGQPLDGADPDSFALTDTPVSSDPGEPAEGELPSDTLSEDVLVRVRDVEVIKPLGTSAFFTRTLYYADGYADAGKVINTLELANLSSSTSTTYQVIARYESGFRDQVLAKGTLSDSETRTITISEPSPGTSLARLRDPFAIEVQSTEAGRPLAATMVRQDFDAETSEALTDQSFGRWTFAGGRKDNSGTTFPFVTFLNTSQETATVSVQFFDPNGAGVDANVVMELDGNRRGGLRIADLPGVPEGDFGIRINSTQPIVPAYTEFEVSENDSVGATTLFVPGDGSSLGILPTGRISSGANTTVTQIGFLNTSDQATTVALTFIERDGSINLDAVTMPPQSVSTFDLDTLLPDIETADLFQMRYSTNDEGAVTAHFISTAGQDLVSTRFATQASQVHTFAGAFYPPDRAVVVDPDTGEVLQTGNFLQRFSVSNPSTNNPLTVVTNVLFPDGTEITGSSMTVDPLDTLTFAVDQLPNATAILDKINSDPSFQTFTVTILTQDLENPSIGAGVVDVLSLDTMLDSSFSSLFFQSGPMTLLNNPIFAAGS